MVYASRFKNKGITLIELLVVVAIMALILSISVVALKNFKENQVLNAAADNLKSLTSKAWNSTLSSRDAAVFGIHFEESRIVLFKGETFVEPDENNEEIIFDQSVCLSTIDLNGGGSDTVFKRLTGATDEYGTTTLTLCSKPEEKRTIIIKPTGITEASYD